MEIEEQRVTFVNTTNSSDSISQKENGSNSGKRSISRNTKPEVTQKELCDVVLILKEHLKDRSLEKGIQMIYDFIVKKKPPEKVFCDYVPPLSHIPQAPKNYVYCPRNRSEVIRKYDKNDLISSSFSSEVEQLRFKQKRACAKMFVAHGYGWQMARDQLLRNKPAINLSRQSYKIVMGSVVTSTFREIQTFLQKECFIKILRLQKEELRSTLTFVLGDKISNHGTVFRTFLRYKFGLSKVTIVQTDTVHFYLEVMKLLHKKRLTVQGIQQMYTERANSENRSQSQVHSYQSNQAKIQMADHSQSLQNTRTQLLKAIDQRIVELTKHQKDLTVICQNVSKDFNLTTPQVEQKMLYLVKKSLIKVDEQSKKQGSSFPKLTELSEKQIQLLCYVTDFYDLRVNLLEFQLSNQLNHDDLFFLVEMINQSKDLLAVQMQKSLRTHNERELEGFSSPFEQNDNFM